MKNSNNYFKNFIDFINSNKEKLNLMLDINEDNNLNSIERFKRGNKIKIKDSQKGSFTKYCNGKVTEECILRGKNSPDPKIRKKAVFALNSRHWHKD